MNKNTLIEVLKAIKIEHQKEYDYNDSECIDEVANYELGYIDCLKEIIKLLEREEQ